MKRNLEYGLLKLRKSFEKSCYFRPTIFFKGFAGGAQPYVNTLNKGLVPPENGLKTGVPNSRQGRKFGTQTSISLS
jgi:hypothetical protein